LCFGHDCYRSTVSEKGQDLEDAQTMDEADVIDDARRRAGDSEGKPSANHVLSCSDLDDRIGQFTGATQTRMHHATKSILANILHETSRGSICSRVAIIPHILGC
jgi:hypothetical protein